MVLGLGRHEERQPSRDGQGNKLQSFDSTNDIVGMTVRIGVAADTRVSFAPCHRHRHASSACSAPCELPLMSRVIDIGVFVSLKCLHLLSDAAVAKADQLRSDTGPDPHMTQPKTHDATIRFNDQYMLEPHGATCRIRISDGYYNAIRCP